MIQKSKEYRENNKDKIRERGITYRQVNKDHIAVRRKKYREEHAEVLKEKRKSGAELLSAACIVIEQFVKILYLNIRKQNIVKNFKIKYLVQKIKIII